MGTKVASKTKTRNVLGVLNNGSPMKRDRASSKRVLRSRTKSGQGKGALKSATTGEPSVSLSSTTNSNNGPRVRVSPRKAVLKTNNRYTKSQPTNTSLSTTRISTRARDVTPGSINGVPTAIHAPRPSPSVKLVRLSADKSGGKSPTELPENCPGVSKHLLSVKATGARLPMVVVSPTLPVGVRRSSRTLTPRMNLSNESRRVSNSPQSKCSTNTLSQGTKPGVISTVISKAVPTAKSAVVFPTRAEAGSAAKSRAVSSGKSQAVSAGESKVVFPRPSCYRPAYSYSAFNKKAEKILEQSFSQHSGSSVLNESSLRHDTSSSPSLSAPSARISATKRSPMSTSLFVTPRKCRASPSSDGVASNTQSPVQPRIVQRTLVASDGNKENQSSGRKEVNRRVRVTPRRSVSVNKAADTPSTKWLGSKQADERAVSHESGLTKAQRIKTNNPNKKRIKKNRPDAFFHVYDFENEPSDGEDKEKKKPKRVRTRKQVKPVSSNTRKEQAVTRPVSKRNVSVVLKASEGTARLKSKNFAQPSLVPSTLGASVLSRLNNHSSSSIVSLPGFKRVGSQNVNKSRKEVPEKTSEKSITGEPTAGRSQAVEYDSIAVLGYSCMEIREIGVDSGSVEQPVDSHECSNASNIMLPVAASQDNSTGDAPSSILRSSSAKRKSRRSSVHNMSVRFAATSVIDPDVSHKRDLDREVDGNGEFPVNLVTKSSEPQSDSKTDMFVPNKVIFSPGTIETSTPMFSAGRTHTANAQLLKSDGEHHSLVSPIALCMSASASAEKGDSGNIINSNARSDENTNSASPLQLQPQRSSGRKRKEMERLGVELESLENPEEQLPGKRREADEESTKGTSGSAVSSKDLFSDAGSGGKLSTRVSFEELSAGLFGTDVEKTAAEGPSAGSASFVEGGSSFVERKSFHFLESLSSDTTDGSRMAGDSSGSEVKTYGRKGATYTNRRKKMSKHQAKVKTSSKEAMSKKSSKRSAKRKEAAKQRSATAEQRRRRSDQYQKVDQLFEGVDEFELCFE